MGIYEYLQIKPETSFCKLFTLNVKKTLIMIINRDTEKQKNQGPSKWLFWYELKGDV